MHRCWHRPRAINQKGPSTLGNCGRISICGQNRPQAAKIQIPTSIWQVDGSLSQVTMGSFGVPSATGISCSGALHPTYSYKEVDKDLQNVT